MFVLCMEICLVVVFNEMNLDISKRKCLAQRTGILMSEFDASLHSGQVVHQAGTYLRFLRHEATRSISTPPLIGMPVHRRVTPSIKFAGTHLCTWVERGTACNS